MAQYFIKHKLPVHKTGQHVHVGDTILFTKSYLDCRTLDCGTMYVVI
jgi:hypothetical protein